MGTPSKKRKLNSSAKPSPSSSRNLDHFFGKQQQNLPIQTSEALLAGSTNEVPALTDEELARKLQAQWDEEEEQAQNFQKETSLKSIGQSESSSNLPQVLEEDTALEKLVGDEDVDVSIVPDSKPQAPFFGFKDRSTLSLQSGSTAEDLISSNIPFDESPLTFEPSKYVADLQGHWLAEGGDASYALLTRCFVLVNGTQSRIKIVDTLVNLLRVLIEGDPSSLLPTVRPKTPDSSTCSS
jgi:DNA ligase-1